MARIVDLSKPIAYNFGDPFYMRVRVRHKAHKKARLLIRLLGLKLFPQGFAGWADDSFAMGVHATTHLDAPWHYGPSCAGKPARTIDQIPLEWCYAPGLVLDLSHKPDAEPVTVADLEAALTKENLTIRPGDIVLIRTGRDKFMGQRDFPERGPGVSRAATEWLIAQGVKIMGIDQWGWDAPLKSQIARIKQGADPELFWEAHRVGTRQEYCHIEQLANLDSLPPSGFKLAVFPLKIMGASGAPARVVAIFED